MTVLSAAQSAGIRLLGRKPNSLFSASDQFGLELGELASEAAADIVDYYDWQKLKKLQTDVGDGATMAFNLPTDYRRMLKSGKIHSQMWRTRNFRAAKDEDEWLLLQDISLAGTPGVWIILSGQMQYFPALPVSETARYYYISNYFVATGAGLSGSKSSFTADADVFLLDERLITLSLIWRWRAQKRLEYAQDLANFEKAQDTAVAADKGARLLVVGTQTYPAQTVAPYPGVLGPS